MTRRRIAWNRSEDGMSAHGTLGPVDVRVWRDRDNKKGFLWEAQGFAADREQAFEQAERAVLATMATRLDADWLRSLTHDAHAGTAYIMVNGVRDTQSLMALCNLAMSAPKRKA